MTVTNALVNSGNPQTRALPANGVIYVPTAPAAAAR